MSTVPGAPPVLDTTWLYAFLAEKAKSIAYQQSKFSLLISSSYAAIQINHNSRKVLKDTDEYPSSLLRLAQVEGTTSFELLSPKKFVEVGSQFNDKYSEVTATSFADWDGKTYSIGINVGGRNVKYIQAPFTYALAKAGSDAAGILGNLAATRRERSSLPLKDGQFNISFTSSLPNPPSPQPRLYLLRQPVNFEGPSGRVCFLAATYSPIPIPQEYLSCPAEMP